jgi:hypothetical protein
MSNTDILTELNKLIERDYPGSALSVPPAPAPPRALPSGFRVDPIQTKKPAGESSGRPAPLNVPVADVPELPAGFVLDDAPAGPPAPTAKPVEKGLLGDFGRLTPPEQIAAAEANREAGVQQTLRATERAQELEQLQGLELGNNPEIEAVAEISRAEQSRAPVETSLDPAAGIVRGAQRVMQANDQLAGNAPLPSQTRTRNAIDTAARTLLSTGPDVAKSTGIVAGLAPGIDEENLITEIADDAEAAITSAFPGDYTKADEFTTALAGGAGSMAGFMLGNVVASAGAKAVGASGRVAGMIGAAGTGAAVQGVQGYEEAKEAGAKALGRYVSFFLNAGLGTSEAVPIDRFFGRLNQVSGGRVSKILADTKAQSLEEFVQEVGQSLGSDVIAKAVYDPDREINVDEALKSGVVGAILGGAMGATSGAVSPLERDGAGPGGGTPPAAEVSTAPPLPAPKPAPDRDLPAAEAPEAAVEAEPLQIETKGVYRATPEGALERATLRQYGYSDADIDGMSAEERAAEAADAIEQGVRTDEQAVADAGTYEQELERQSKGDGSIGNPIRIETAADLDQAIDIANTEPTEGQKEAGNYRKVHIRYHGLDIAIENPKGSVRRGRDPQGREWSNELPAHYGYIKRTEGADGDQIDVYIGDSPEPGNTRVFVIDQRDPDTGKFDEHKLILGARSREEAIDIYERAFDDGSAMDRAGGIAETDIESIRQWLKGGDLTGPITQGMAARREEGEAGAPGDAIELAAAPPLRNDGAADQALPVPDEASDVEPIQVKQRRWNPGRGIVGFIKANGGLRPVGELDAMDLRRSRPGTVSNRGRSLDDMREIAAEAGYFNGTYGTTERAIAESTPNDLLELLKAELSGQRAETIEEQYERDPLAMSPAEENIEAAARDEATAALDALAEEYELDIPADLRERAIYILMVDPSQQPDDALERAAIELEDEIVQVAQSEGVDIDVDELPGWTDAELDARNEAGQKTPYEAGTDARPGREGPEGQRVDGAGPDGGRAEPEDAGETGRGEEGERVTFTEDGPWDFVDTFPLPKIVRGTGRFNVDLRDVDIVDGLMTDILSAMGSDIEVIEGTKRILREMKTGTGPFDAQDRESAIADYVDAAKLQLKQAQQELRDLQAELKPVFSADAIQAMMAHAKKDYLENRSEGDGWFPVRPYDETPQDDLGKPYDHGKGRADYGKKGEPFPAPDKEAIRNTIKEAGETVSQEQADAELAVWKEIAKEVGRTTDNSDKVILSLFDSTGNWSQPFVDAGYDVIRLDIQDGQDIFENFPIIDIMDKLEQGKTFHGVMSACPCTTFTGTGARWWPTQHDLVNPDKVEQIFGPKTAKTFDTALDANVWMVHMTAAAVDHAKPTFHVLENPIGRIQKETGLPPALMKFNPNDFGDPYTKQTQLFGDFNTDLPLNRVEATQGSKIQSKLRGDDPVQKRERSTTPEGFSYAFFIANDPTAKALYQERQQSAPGIGNPAPDTFDADFDDAFEAALDARFPEERSPATEEGADGKEQLVIPGAGKVGDGKRAQMQADAPLKPKKDQKPTDFGLFGDDMNQTAMDEVLNPPEPEGRSWAEKTEDFTTGREVLQAIIDDPSAPRDYAFIAERIIDDVAAVPVRILRPGDDAPAIVANAMNATAYAVYYVNRTAGTESVYARPGADMEVLLHEFLHAAINEKVDQHNNTKFEDAAVGKAIKDLHELMVETRRTFRERARKGELSEVDKRSLRFASAMADVREFIAYGLTDPKFQDFLKSVELKVERKTFWNRFVATLRSMLKIPNAQDNALSELIQKTDHLMAVDWVASSAIVDGRRTETVNDAPSSKGTKKIRKKANSAGFAKEVMGADIGDTVTLSANLGAVPAGRPYLVEAIDDAGTVLLINRDGGPSATLSRTELRRAKKEGITFAVEKQTIGEVAGSAVKNVGMSLDQASKGLLELFGGGKTVGSGPAFDEETYKKALPYFRAAASHFAAAGKDVRKIVEILVNHLIDNYGFNRETLKNMEPYIKRYSRDLITGAETVDVSGSGADVEPNSPGTIPGDGVGGDLLPDGSGDAERGSREGGSAPDQDGGFDGGRGGIPADRADALGAQGNRPASDQSSGGRRGDIPDRTGERGGDAGLERPAPETIGAKRVAEASADGAAVARRLKAQREVDTNPPVIVEGDLDNIRASLPALLPQQQEDVYKAETRYAQIGQKNAYGMLFTNGTGTGKTFTGAGIIKRLAMRGHEDQLVLAPTQGIVNEWKRTLALFGIDAHILESTNDPGKGVTLTTYANFYDNYTFLERNFSHITADESHSLNSNKDGGATDALNMFRAVTGHPRGYFQRAKLHYGAEWKEVSTKRQRARIVEKRMDDLIEEIRTGRATDRAAAERDLGKLRKEANEIAAFMASPAREELFNKTREKSAELSANPPPRATVTFLSATPFAYDKSIDYAEGYLFEYQTLKPGEDLSYNAGDARDRFFMENFGYRMRYNKLTKPEAGVKSETLEREFHEKLKREGALSGRHLDLDVDYERVFVAVDDLVGTKIDEAMSWLGKAGRRYDKIAERVYKQFDYLARMRLLEAIKANHAVERIKQHHSMGRKVVVFHDFIEGGGINPFLMSIDPEEMHSYSEYDKDSGQTGPLIEVPLAEVYQEFLDANPFVLEFDFTSYRAPIATMKKNFPGALFYNGRETKGAREKAKARFNDDADQEANLIVVLSAAGEAGISLHDTSGKHQRALINLGMPNRPVTAIQTEGRIYRTGQVTNATFEYFNTGTAWERMAFAHKIAERSGTAENLALGNDARALRESFIQAFENTDEFPVGREGEGLGGKDADRAFRSSISGFERSKTFYYAQQKKRGKRNQREGVDYYATPEPVGYMMVEMTETKPGQDILEPSAGHGAIARWFPETASRTLIEPSGDLLSRAALASPGAKTVGTTFEQHNIVNKYDSIAMNPPFGAGGSTAVKHVAKAFKHLRNGGRLVALIPRGPAADKKFDAWMESDESKDGYVVASYDLPQVTFTRAGTQAATRIVIIDKHKDKEVVAKLGNLTRDYSSAETIEALFDRMEEATIPRRHEPLTKELAISEGETTAGDYEVDIAEDLKSVTIAQKISDEERRTMSQLARQHGGQYEGNRGRGRSALFRFPSAQELQSFLGALASSGPGAMPAASAPSPAAGGGSRAGAALTSVYETAETKHGKTGEDLYVAIRTERVDMDEFKRLAAVARTFGGWYSKYRGNGAIPGFQFRSAEDRAAFIDETSGAADERVSMAIRKGISKKDQKRIARLAMETARSAGFQMAMDFDAPPQVDRSIYRTVNGAQVQFPDEYQAEVYTVGAALMIENGIGAEPAMMSDFEDPQIGKHRGELDRLAREIGPYMDPPVSTAAQMARAAIEIAGTEQDFRQGDRKAASIIDADQHREWGEKVAADLRTRLGRSVQHEPDAPLEGLTDLDRWQNAQFSVAPPRTSSSNFRQWFGDSKVVDEKGDPLVVYHGTGYDFDAFSDQTGGEDPVFYFTSKKSVAKEYARLGNGLEGKGERVISAYLSLKNPLEINWPARVREAERAGFPLRNHAGNDGTFFDEKLMAEVVSQADANGNDGLIITNIRDGLDAGADLATTYIAFNPKQIKSVNNRGTFDPGDSRIAFSAAPEGWGFADPGDPLAMTAAQEADARQIIADVAALENVLFADRLTFPASHPGAKAWGARGDMDVGGMYSPSADSIVISKAAGAADRVAFHESFHRLQARFLTEQEKATLSRESERLKDIVRSAGFRDVESMSQREIEAEAFAIYAQRRRAEQPTGPMHAGARRILERFLRFASRLRNMMMLNGFDDVYSIFDRARRGKIAQRGPRPGAAPTGPDQFSAIPPYVQNMLSRQANRTVASAGRISDAVRVKIQDKALPIRRVQEAVEEAIGQRLPDHLDVYMTEGLYQGRTGERLNDLHMFKIEPILDEMRKRGLDPQEVNDYLYARHAKERDEVIAQRNPKMKNGSGMPPREREAILAQAAQRQGDFDAVVGMIDAMQEETRKLLVSSGLLSKEEMANWRNRYEHYVPLRGWEADPVNDEHPRSGRGFDIRGKESHSALGRRTKADQPLAYIVLQAEQAILRSEKNRVGKTMLRLVRAVPNPNLWQVSRGEVRRRINPNTGLVESYYVPPAFIRSEDLFRVMQGGKPHFIEIKHKGLARALRGIGYDQHNIVLKWMMRTMRFYASMLTQWSPSFILPNMVRDMETALVNISDVRDKPAGVRRQMITDILQAKTLRGIFMALQNPNNQGEYARWFEEFRAAGGKISLVNLNDVGTIKDNIEASLTRGGGARAWLAAMKVISDVNTTIENGVRLSTYIALRKNGFTQARAAFIARELTVNFNRRGEWGPYINTLYLFFNASIQGTTRLAQAIVRSKVARRAVMGLAVAGITMEYLNAMMSGEDDDGETYYDQIPSWIKQRNVVVMIPGTDRYFLLPKAYGYNVPFFMGQQLGAILRGKRDPADALGDVVLTAMDSFNPVGSAPSLTQYLSPTMTDPMVQIAENMTFYGGPIYPTKFDSRKPDSENYFSSVPEWAKEVAQIMNTATGGNVGRPGMIDVSPETIEHYMEFISGGLGKFVMNSANTAERALTGEEFLPEKAPVIRRFYGRGGTSEAMVRRFYEAYREVDQAAYEFDRLGKSGARDSQRETYREFKTEIRFAKAFRSVRKDLTELRKRKEAISRDRNLSAAQRRERLAEVEETIRNRVTSVMKPYMAAKGQ